jgi:hypothetical protein
MRSHLQGCALKLQTVKSHQAMAEAMQNTAKAMSKMNKAVNVQTITSKYTVYFVVDDSMAIHNMLYLILCFFRLQK